MVYEIIITKIALNDLKAAIKWYNKKDAVIGVRLISNFEIAVEKLKTNPQIYTLISKEVRNIDISKFPYKILFHINSHYEVIIIGVVHKKRSDDFTHKKLQSFKK